MSSKEIINALPYQYPFLFVDTLSFISNTVAIGSYTFKKDAFFYKGHFKNKPITPGVILTETMAQIGLVCLGLYLIKDNISELSKPQIAMSSSYIDFYLPVYPEEKITVFSKKEYFRFNKLKCSVKMLNSKKDLVCKGTISGMIKSV